MTVALREVWASAADDAWAVGDGGTVVRWDGATWTPITLVTDADLYAIWGTGSDEIWAVGYPTSGGGVVLRYGPP